MIACSPGRIGADGSESGESGSGSGSASEDGPIVETGEGDGDGDEDPWTPGGCDGDADGSAKWLDICPEPNPCDDVDCGSEECIGGMCVAVVPELECEGLELIELELAVSFGPSAGAPLLADIDGMPGDELISADEGMVEVMLGDQLVVSDTLPPGAVHSLEALTLDADGLPDLLVHSLPSEAAYTRALLGDGLGGFTAPGNDLDDAGLDRPFTIDFDNDGDHDVLGWAPGAQSTFLFENVAGTLEFVSGFRIDGSLGVAVDIDLDGFVDDALFAGYPSPTLLRGDAGVLVNDGVLPESMRGPNLEYGLGRPVAGDLDGDGFVEVASVIIDNWGSVGVRIWWGLPGGGFDQPRDQLLDPFNRWGVTPHLVGIVELDGVAPPELLIQHGTALVYARPDIANHLPFACVTSLYAGSMQSHVGLGDLEGDGQFEVAARLVGQLRLFTLAPG